MTILPLFTSRCACCRQPGADLCRPCRFALASSRSVQVASPHGGATVLAALEFDGAVRRAILALKFANRRTVARHLASLVVRRLGLDERRSPSGRPPFDVVTWAPTSTSRARRRGYDQAQLLAHHIAGQLGVPCRRLLWRQHGGPQAGLGRAQRLRGPAFRAKSPVRPLRVLLVDDVVTTGSTLQAAAIALRQAGVGHVTAVAVAATPDHIIRPKSAAPTPLAPVIPIGLLRAG